MITKERRRHVRRSVSIPVKFTVQSNLYRGLAYNISDGGIFIDVTGPFKVGQDISIISPADQVSLRSIGNNRAGSIVWISPHGIGMKFKKP
ncbi:hypothetical protein LCGC14_1945040 [marine sediment metagenome]|uniref:PilZ domain-containing protein n=1 Tax=marine sediment metagenome TaxID=412755 RepID=A0A0F9FJF9_9ZZZZ